MSDHNDTELVVQQEGPVVQVTMNRPAALNALSLEMIRMLSARLDEWAAQEGPAAVFVRGAGERAFCAGGDVKSSYRTGMAFRRGDTDSGVLTLFFAEEYCLNRQLFHCKRPLIALMNGITMGGGYGIAGPCRYRIASESTVFAMPETIIGFFPDVGSMYFLNRAPGEAGTWLALTGNSVGAADMIHCGLATHYVPLERQPEMEQAVAAAVAKAQEGEADKAIAAVLADYHEDPGTGVLAKNREAIDSCFAASRMEMIMSQLRAADTDWCREQLATLEARSPTSLKVSLAHLRMSKTMSFDEVTAQDYTLAKHFMQGHDFYEGVRAQLIDKDRKPQWEPQTLEEVITEMVQDYFRPRGRALDEIAA